jgi:hypothetical protein
MISASSIPFCGHPKDDEAQFELASAKNKADAIIDGIEDLEEVLIREEGVRKYDGRTHGSAPTPALVHDDGPP